MNFLRSILLLSVLVCGLASCGANAGSYAFVDEQGGVHLSNVPDDNRYLALEPRPLPAAPASLREDGLLRRPYNAVVELAAEQSGVEAALLHAMITVESGYNARAVSKRGAAGLMQLMPETARRFGVANVFDPTQNVRAGARYLTELLNTFDNDLELALAAYNAGEGAVIKFGRRIPPYRETAEYVPKVIDIYRKYSMSM